MGGQGAGERGAGFLKGLFITTYHRILMMERADTIVIWGKQTNKKEKEKQALLFFWW